MSMVAEEIDSASRHLKPGSLALNCIIPHSPFRGPGLGAQRCRWFDSQQFETPLPSPMIMDMRCGRTPLKTSCLWVHAMMDWWF